jgi:hypothetical protein
MRFGVVAAPDGVLGWFDGDNWIQAQDRAPIDGGEEVQIIRLGREVTSAVTSGLDAGCELVQPSVGLMIDDAEWGYGDAFASTPIAVAAPWDATPHPVAVLEPSSLYVEAARDLLGAIGVDEPDPRFAQLVRIDLEGDGVDEVFGVVERRTDPSGSLIPAEPGDYSVAFVRAVVDEKVETTVLAQWVVVEQEQEGFIQDLVIFRIDAFADADGDGTDELALRTSYYEGSGVGLWDRGTFGFEQVISAGCGA